jgi:hypothetical protein
MVLKGGQWLDHQTIGQAGSAHSFSVMKDSTIVSLINVLEQLKEEIIDLDDEIYTKKCKNVMDSSIGQHVRHSLDHFNKLVFPAGPIVNYDIRQRKIPVETSVQAAVSLVSLLCQELAKMSDLDKTIDVEVMLNAAGEQAKLKSTFRRELWFVCHHAVHHNAMIRMILEIYSMPIKDGSFGYAPSTANFRKIKPT